MNDAEFEKTLLDAALGVPSLEERARFLERVCAGDAALRERLERLLADYAEAETFFDFTPEVPTRPAEPAASASPAAPPAVTPAVGPSGFEADPGRIGCYRIIRRLGEGGCGIVYLAEQDEPVRRQVALKVIRQGMDTERVIARFALERQALALMNHPHIARVLDVGATEAGRTYFVMELVAGERITTFCDRLRLSLRERLELFILVCRAVQHAHQKGIIHRDLKPSNVLVTRQDGVTVPKIIDFGVAKAFSERADDDPGTLAAEQFIGTPAYMSPEQAEWGRQDVDTRSDVYGLGALLYELLTGRPPFDSRRLRAAGLDELRRILREEEPPRPSVLVQRLPPAEQTALAGCLRCTPEGLLAALRRDLDWVVLRALAKERQDRYTTVQGLALDLRRYLDDEPVVARPPSAMYQAAKLLRRHRFAFLSGAAILVVLVGGLGVSTWLYVREREAVQAQTRLRAAAEETERITRAMLLVREGQVEEANALLAEVSRSAARPSLDAVTTYRAVGNWLAEQARWTEVAERFAIVERVGWFDSWTGVTIDHQAYGVALLLCDDLAAYEGFRREKTSHFANVTNGDAVARVLKTCLLRPPEASLLRQMEPLGKCAEEWFAGLPPATTASWAAIPIALWRYRNDDLTGAEQVAGIGYDARDHASARTATLRALLALCAWRQGRTVEAVELLETAQEDVAGRFARGLAGGNGRDGYWYDWAFAKLLVQEAQKTLGTSR